MSPFAMPKNSFRPRALRAGCAVAGFIAGTFVTTSVVALFGAASDTPWLPATPEAIARAASCEALPSRDARDACMHDARLAWAATRHADLRVASSH